MSAAANFARWAEACEDLALAGRDRHTPAQIIAARCQVAEALEILLRSLIAAHRHNQAAIDRAADNVQAALDGEVEPVWVRLAAHERRIAQLEAVLVAYEELPQ
jgi:hypothetical protein